MNKLNRTFIFGILVSLGFVTYPSLTRAEIIADKGGPDVLKTANGIPQINIRNPNNNPTKTSLNPVIEFDLPKRVIFNNAQLHEVQTQFAGWIPPNPHVAGGPAKIIIIQVRSSKPSLLNGFIEVAGTSAQVIIANPSGIICDGCGFINANRATITTGVPIITNGNLDGYRVERGTITINGAGLNNSNVDYTDLIARSVIRNADIHAKQLNIITGTNKVDANAYVDKNGKTHGVQKIAGERNDKEKPLLAIDTGSLGGMYAGKIFLIGTEDGVGMRNAGNIGATAGEVIISTAGSLENNGKIGADHILINADTLTNKSKDAVITARDRLDIGAREINNQDHASILSEGKLAIGRSINFETGKISKNERATVLNNDNATIESKTNISFYVDDIKNINSAKIISGKAGSSGSSVVNWVKWGVGQGDDPNRGIAFYTNSILSENSKIISGGDIFINDQKANKVKDAPGGVLQNIGTPDDYEGNNETKRQSVSTNFNFSELIGLFQVKSNASYVIETDPIFTNRRQWLNSEYMLKALSIDPAHVLKRLGDGFYEQRLVSEQVMQLTGRRFLHNHKNDEEQYRKLMDNGIKFAKAQSQKGYQLIPGVILSKELVEQLTSDIVWLEEKEIILPNGETIKVLAPKLYLDAKNRTTRDFNALISAKNIKFKVKDIFNSGIIVGKKFITLTAENINNLAGKISGRGIAVKTSGDINSVDGTMQSEKGIVLKAGHDINIAGSNIISPRKVNITGSRVDIKETHKEYQGQTENHSKQNTTSGSSISQVSTQEIKNIATGSVIAAKNIKIRATAKQKDQTKQAHDLTIQGSQIQAKNDVTLKADDQVILPAAKNEAMRKSESSSSGTSVEKSVGADGSLTTRGTKSASEKTESSDITQVNTKIAAGNKLKIKSGAGTTIKGAVINAKQVSANVGADLKLESVQDTSNYDSYSKNQNSDGRTTQNKMHSDYSSVAEQTAIKSKERPKIKVQGTTELKGAAITSEKPGQVIKTTKLVKSDIQNKAEYNAQTTTFGFGPNSSVPLVASAKGRAESTTKSGVNLVNQETANKLNPIFDKEKIENRFEIAKDLTKKVGALIEDRAKEIDAKKAEAKKLESLAQDLSNNLTEVERHSLSKQAEQLRAEAESIKKKWSANGIFRLKATTYEAAVISNVMATPEEVAQKVKVNYAQQQAAAEVGAKVRAGELIEGSQEHAAMHGEVGRLGARASGQDETSGAWGAAASSYLTNLFGAAKPNETQIEKETKRNAILNLVTRDAVLNGIEPTTATMAAMAALDNNYLTLEQEQQKEQKLAPIHKEIRQLEEKVASNVISNLEKASDYAKLADLKEKEKKVDKDYNRQSRIQNVAHMLGSTVGAIEVIGKNFLKTAEFVGERTPPDFIENPVFGAKSTEQQLNKAIAVVEQNKKDAEIIREFVKESHKYLKGNSFSKIGFDLKERVKQGISAWGQAAKDKLFPYYRSGGGIEHAFKTGIASGEVFTPAVASLGGVTGAAEGLVALGKSVSASASLAKTAISKVGKGRIKAGVNAAENQLAKTRSLKHPDGKTGEIHIIYDSAKKLHKVMEDLYKRIIEYYNQYYYQASSPRQDIS